MGTGVQPAKPSRECVNITKTAGACRFLARARATQKMDQHTDGETFIRPPEMRFKSLGDLCDSLAESDHQRRLSVAKWTQGMSEH
jgi:hypothetical protein